MSHSIKKAIIILALFITVIIAIMWYPLRLDRYGLFVKAEIDYVDAVKIDDQFYYSWDFPREEVDAKDVGDKIGSVKFKESENVSNPNYKTRNWDASFLEVGTEIYKVIGNEYAIAAYVDGKYYRFARRYELDENRLRTQYNLGMTEEEIKELTDDELADIFSPGAQLDGASYAFTEVELKELGTRGISEEKAIILSNLGYRFDEMKLLTKKELDFIFPTSQLVLKLVQKGYEEERVNSRGALLENGYENYKQLIEEAIGD